MIFWISILADKILSCYPYNNMDTDSFYLVISGDSLDEIVKARNRHI